MRKLKSVIRISITLNILFSINSLMAVENESERRTSLTRMKRFLGLHPIGITPERMVSDGTSPDSPPPAPHPLKESTPLFPDWPQNIPSESNTAPPAA